VRVAVYHANDDVRVEQRPRPQIGPRELLVRVRASGICGSDVMEWYRRPRAPIVLGHEIAGTVEAVGAGVERFVPGERVVATHHVPCNRCRFCLSDRHAVCDTLHATQFDPGGFAEFVRLTPIHVDRGVLTLPDAVDFEVGTFVEPLACTVRGQRLAGCRPGEIVAVVGCGVAGLLHVLLARAQGAGTIVAVDLADYRLDAARCVGADIALPAGVDLVERLTATTGGRLADRVLVCTSARTAVEQAPRLVERGGTILLFAPMSPGERLDWPALDLWRRGVTLTHAYAGPPAEMRIALDLLAARRVDVTPLSTHRLPLEEAAKGFRLVAQAQDSLKVLLVP
jgi:L-iditol 2-dehydrogenase